MKHLEKVGVFEMKAKEQREVSGCEIQPECAAGAALGCAAAATFL